MPGTRERNCIEAEIPSVTELVPFYNSVSQNRQRNLEILCTDVRLLFSNNKATFIKVFFLHFSMKIRHHVSTSFVSKDQFHFLTCLH